MIRKFLLPLSIILFYGFYIFQYIEYIDYWKSRQMVSFHVQYDSNGIITSSRLLGSYVENVNTDSLGTSLIGRFLPEKSRYSSKGSVVSFAFDMNLDRIDIKLKKLLPRKVVKDLENSQLNIWSDGLESFDERFSIRKFVLHYSAGLHDMDYKCDIDKILNSEKMKRGILEISPGRKYLLDAYKYMELFDNGKPGWDADSGWILYDLEKRTRFISVTNNFGSYIAGKWIDENMFYIISDFRVIPNDFQIDHQWAPGVTLVNISSMKYEVYLGPPVSKFVINDYGAKTSIRKVLFPDIKW